MKLVRVLVVGVGVGGAGESHESDMSDVSEVGVVVLICAEVTMARHATLSSHRSAGDNGS